jgi:hydroxylamine reductase
MKKKQITKDMKIGEILEIDPENAITLMGFGMHCCGCPMSQAETLEQACQVHGLDVDFVVARLNDKA